MHIPQLFLTLSSAASLAAALKSPPEDSAYLPNRFIVEFADPQTLSKRSLRNDPTDAFVNVLHSRGFPARPAFSYDADELFVGASFDAAHDFDTDEELVALIQSFPEVRNVWPVRVFKILDSEEMDTTADIVVDSSNSRDLSLDAVFVPAADSDEPISNFSSSDPATVNYPQWSAHSLTGVAALHQRNLTGNGVTIGIIDSGAFYLDKALGGGFGPGFKVAGGWNFFGNVYDPNIQGYGVPNNDTLDRLGHGTFVTGVAAGRDGDDFVGVAPDATIMAYRVFAYTESTSEDVVLAALQRAYSDNVDVINLSIGADGGGYQGNALSTVADRISSTGIYIVGSAGNSGYGGPFNGNDAATSNLTTSVGSTSTGQLLGYEATARSSSGDSYRFTFIQPKGVQLNTTATYPLTIANDTACKLSGSIAQGPGNQTAAAIVFPQDSSCAGFSFYQAAHGLGYALIVSYESDSAAPPTAPTQYIEDSIFRITAESGFGAWASVQAQQGNTVELVFDSSSAIPRSIIDGSRQTVTPSAFSSFGPDYSGNLYPHVSAPGERMYSTWLNYSRSVQDGTSFSAPYVTGLIALYIQSIGGRPANSTTFVETVRSRLIQTASALKIDDNTVYPLIGQGAGLINATSFLDTKTLVTSSPIINLGLSPASNQTVSVELYNGNDNDVTYTLSHIYASTILAKSPSNRIFGFSQPLVSQPVNVQFESTEVTIPANSGRSISVQLAIPDSIKTEYSPIFQGKLVASGANGEQVSVPYIATVTDDYKVWNDQHQPVFIYNSNEAAVLTAQNTSETVIPLLNSSSNAMLYSPLLTGATYYTVAVVQENYTFSLPVTNGKNGVVMQLSGFPVQQMARSPAGFYARVSIPGIPSGTYRMFTAALPAIPNISYNASTPEDYQTWFSTPFNYNSTGAYTVSSTRSALAPDLGTNLGGVLVLQPTVTSVNTNASLAISPYDTFQVSIPFQALNGFKVGYKFNVTLPEQFTGFPEPFKVFDRSGAAILDVTISNDTNILQATVLADPQRTLITGNFIFGCRLANPQQYTASTQLPIVFFSANLPRFYSTTILDLAVGDKAFPSVVTYTSDSGDSVVDVLIPAAFGGWQNLTVDIVSPAYGFDCAGVTVLQTSSLQSLDLTSTANTTAFSAASVACANSAGGRNAASIVLANPPQSDQTLRLVLPVQTGNASSVVRQAPIYGRIYGSVFGQNFTYTLSQKLNNAGLVSYSRPMTGWARS